MIDFESVMTRHERDEIIQDIYCCDCLFETLMELLHIKNLKYEKFIQILTEKFPKRHLFLYFSSINVFMCNHTFKFIAEDIEINFDSIYKSFCITDLINIENENFQVCVVCLIKIVVSRNYLKRFRLLDKYRSNVEYFQLEKKC